MIFVARMIGGFFLALACFQVYSGRAFVDFAINPAAVTRHKKPKSFWFFVGMNIAIGLLFILGVQN